MTPADVVVSAERELRRLVDRRAGRLSALAATLGRLQDVVAGSRAFEHRQRDERRALDDQLRRAGAAARATAGARWHDASRVLAALDAELTGTASAASWDDSTAWDVAPVSWLPAGAARVGALRPEHPDPAAAPRVSAFVPGPGVGHVVVSAAESDRAAAVAVIESMIVRAVASARPGAVRFRVYDPIGLGATLTSAGRFDRELVGRGTPMATTRDLRDGLEQLAAHAARVSTEHLQGRVSTLRELAAQGADEPPPFEVLVIFDADRGLDDELREQVRRLAAHGAARGVQILLHTGPATDSPDLGGDAVRLDLGPRGTARASWAPGAAVSLDAAPPSALLDAVAARRPPRGPALAYDDLQPPVDVQSSAAGLAAPIGRSGGELVDLVLGDDPPHGLIAGSSGSGKSNLLRVFLYGLARRYGPGELQLFLLDFKEGVEFQEFAATPSDRTFLPQAAVVSVNSSREFGVEVLRYANRVIAERYRYFNETPGASKLETLRRRRPADELPRIVLVIDEFQRLFDTDDALADAAIEALSNIARQGRAAGVHFLLATQSIGDVGISTSAGTKLEGVFRNAGLRIGMRLSEQASRDIFSSSTNGGAAEIREPGVAIVNAHAGAEEHNVRTRVAYLADDVAVRERRAALTTAIGARRPPRVFDGGRGAEAATNRELRAALRTGGRDDGTWRTWAAESLRIDSDDARASTGLSFGLGRDADRNVAILGSNPFVAFSLLQWATVGLAATSAGASFLLVDTSTPEDLHEHGLPAGLVDATATAARARGASVRVLRTDEGRAVVEGAVRVAGEGAGRAAVVVFGAERLVGFDDLIDPEDGRFDAPTVRSRFAQLAHDGPRRGTHVLGSWSTTHTFDALGSAQTSFGLRSYLRMPEMELRRLAGHEHVVPDGRLALWQDVGRGRGVEIVHAYEPFGTAGIPEWLA